MLRGAGRHRSASRRAEAIWSDATGEEIPRKSLAGVDGVNGVPGSPPAPPPRGPRLPREAATDRRSLSTPFSPRWSACFAPVQDSLKPSICKPILYLRYEDDHSWLRCGQVIGEPGRRRHFGGEVEAQSRGWSRFGAIPAGEARPIRHFAAEAECIAQPRRPEGDRTTGLAARRSTLRTGGGWRVSVEGTLRRPRPPVLHP